MIVEGHLPPGEAVGRLFPRLARRYGFAEGQVRAFRVLRRAVDARGPQGPRVFWRLDLVLGEGSEPARELPPDILPVGRRARPARSVQVRPLIVGSGPAGTFAALRLIEAGVRPLLLEQGKPVEARARDVRVLRATGVLDPCSNVAFGEGGAGTFSDGKLRTRRKDAAIRDVIATFVAHGARPSLLAEAHPHVGTDVLYGVARSIRHELEAAGAELRFGVRVADLLVTDGRVVGVRLADGQDIVGDGVLLAPGNSARPLFAALSARGVRLVPRATAVGFRVEHPRAWVDRTQYGARASAAGLDAAEYSLTAQAEGRGVYSFCMCPGGSVIPSHVEQGTVRVNGMSTSRRGSPWSNSAIVVTVEPADFVRSGEDAPGGDALDGVAFQRAWEAQAATWAGAPGLAPAQGAADFLAGREPGRLPDTSYRPGVAPAPLHTFYPPALTRALAAGLRAFERRMPGFAGCEALLIGPESGTSTPLTMERGPDGQSLTHPGLFPAGEGAGYAGGITSSALDGLRQADAWLAVHGLI